MKTLLRSWYTYQERGNAWTEQDNNQKKESDDVYVFLLRFLLLLLDVAAHIENNSYIERCSGAKNQDPRYWIQESKRFGITMNKIQEAPGAWEKAQTFMSCH